jgi:hypothetical protein
MCYHGYDINTEYMPHVRNTRFLRHIQEKHNICLINLTNTTLGIHRLSPFFNMYAMIMHVYILDDGC